MIPKRGDLPSSDTEDGDEKYVLPDIIAAAYASDYKTVHKLLNLGISVNSVDERDNLSLLHIACMNGDLPLVQLLLKRDREHGDLDFTIRSTYRPRLAWQYAINAHHYELARLVDEAGLNKERPRPPQLKMT